MKRILLHIAVFAAAALAAAGCSTTKRLADGEVLYTGVKKMAVESMTDEKIPGAVESAVKEPLSVKPNNPLYSPYIRTGLPLRLWAYNSFYTERQTGFRAWVFRNFAKKPVLVSDVQPELRVGLVKDILDNNGYFGSSASFEIIRQNSKRARINYRVDVAEAWHYASIGFPAVQGPVTRSIDSLRASTKLHVGDRYNVDTLRAERVRITNVLRNNSYYYFRPEYIEYLADTTRRRLEVDLRMVMAGGIPEAALRPYSIGDINIEIYNMNDYGPMVRYEMKDGLIIYHQEPLKVRDKIFERAVTISPGDPVRVADINQTLTNLTKLGIFRYVNMAVTPIEAIKPSTDKLDLTLSMGMDMPMEAQLETDFSQKSSSFIGPKASFNVKHKNFMRGGEVFSVGVTGGYEWQTGKKANQTLINSYEVGLTASLMLPRFVGPGFIRRNRYDTRTTYQVGADLLNRPKYFRMLSANASFSYDFQTSPRSFHNLTLFKLTYNRKLSTTAEFDQILTDNKALARSFDNQFIPSAAYTYTWSRLVGRQGRDRITWQISPMSAGNLFAGVYRLFGAKGEKKLFGLPFSQFVKGTTEFKYFKQLGDNMVLASRILLGAAHSYGNSEPFNGIPYNEQFTIGGANSIRAFTIRSIGPGSYKPEDDGGYFDQTGDFKLEMNAELRFRILGDLHGAVFLDAGNIWLLEDIDDRPGGKLQMKNFFRELATGTGVGVRYDLSFLVIRADVGVPVHTPYKNPDKGGYYNIPGKVWDNLSFHIAIGYPF